MDLTPAERILIDRRRRKETQHEAAKRYAVCLTTYTQWERGEVPCPHKPPLYQLRAHERCLIQRRRSQITQAEIADKLGRSRRWVTLMERGAVPSMELEEFWGE